MDYQYYLYRISTGHVAIARMDPEGVVRDPCIVRLQAQSSLDIENQQAKLIIESMFNPLPSTDCVLNTQNVIATAIPSELLVEKYKEYLSKIISVRFLSLP